MKIVETNTYKRDIVKSKNAQLQELINKAVALLSDDMQHPSLHVKNIQCKRAPNLYSARVSKQYRIMFFKYDSHLELSRMLDHDKYDRLTKDC